MLGSNADPDCRPWSTMQRTRAPADELDHTVRGTFSPGSQQRSEVAEMSPVPSELAQE